MKKKTKKLHIHFLFQCSIEITWNTSSLIALSIFTQNIPISVVVYWCNHISDFSTGYVFANLYTFNQKKISTVKMAKDLWGKQDFFLMQLHPIIWFKTGVFLCKNLALCTPEMGFCLLHSFFYKPYVVH